MIDFGATGPLTEKEIPVSEKLKKIPDDNIFVQTLRGASSRWAFMAMVAQARNVSTAETAKEMLFARYRKEIEKRLPQLETEAQLALTRELVDAAAPYFKLSLDVDRLRAIVKEKPFTQLPAVVSAASGPEPAESAPVARPPGVQAPVELVVQEETPPLAASIIEVESSMPEISPDIEFDEDDPLANGDFELVDPSEAALMDFLGEKISEPLTDDELWGIAAALALKKIEHLKLSIGAPLVSERLLEVLKGMEPRITKTDAEHLVSLLKDAAGTRFVEEIDDDIPF